LDIGVSVVEELAASVFRIVQEKYAVGGKTGIVQGVGKMGCLSSGLMGNGGGIEQCVWAMWKVQENE
jgi:hypothetical protein